MKKIIAVLFFLTLALIAVCHADQIDMNKIMLIESGGNPNAQEKWGGVGLFQITKPVLVEFKRNIPSVSWEMPDMLNPSNNKEVADWYLNVRIPAMLKHFHKPITIRNIIISYNAGILYVVRNKKLTKTTINYLRKYGIK